MIEYGLLGDPLGHSLSRPLHACFAGYRYDYVQLPRDEAMEFVRKREFRGLNVTIPYKTDVIGLCDEITDDVRAAGSANTLFWDGDRLIAGNTDIDGAKRMIAESGISLAGKTCVILGSGGTAGTMNAVCRGSGAARIWTVSRKGPFDYRALWDRREEAEIIINTTPVGMYPDTEKTPVELRDYRRLQGVLDVIYNPTRTALLRRAAETGIPCAGGLWMLCEQGRRACELFTGARVPREKTREAYDRLAAILRDAEKDAPEK